MAIDRAGFIYLATGSHVSSLEPVNRNFSAEMETAGIVRSMDLSDNGQFLRVAVPDRIHVIDLSTGEEVGGLILPTRQQVILGGYKPSSRFHLAC